MIYKLKDLGSLKNGANYPKGSYGTGVKIVNVKDLFPSHFIDCSELSELKRGVIKNLDAYLLQHGDILFTRSSLVQSGTGMCAMVEHPRESIIFCGFIIRFRANLELVNPYYFVYLLRSPKYRQMFIQFAAQTTITNLNQKSLGEVEVDLPSIEQQGKIARTLKLYDDKIKTNEKINENLQEQAKSIYSKMIIEDADESWTPGVLSDIAIITMGQSPKGDTYNEDGVGTVFFQGRAEFGFRFPTRRLSTTDPKRMAQTNDALMSVRAPVGDMNVAYEDCCIGRGLAAIRSKDDHQSFVLYTLFDLRDELNVFNSEGTVFGSINRDALNSMPISIPPKRVMDEFEVIVSPIDAAIRNNYDEICHLEAIRDNLLPRLMSGELDVSDLNL